MNSNVKSPSIFCIWTGSSREPNTCRTDVVTELVMPYGDFEIVLNVVFRIWFYPLCFVVWARISLLSRDYYLLSANTISEKRCFPQLLCLKTSIVAKQRLKNCTIDGCERKRWLLVLYFHCTNSVLLILLWRFLRGKSSKRRLCSIYATDFDSEQCLLGSPTNDILSKKY